MKLVVLLVSAPIFSIRFNQNPVESIVTRKVFSSADSWVNCVLGVVCSENQIRATVGGGVLTLTPQVLVGSRLKFTSSLSTEFGRDDSPFRVSFGAREKQKLSTKPCFRLSNLFGFKGESGPVPTSLRQACSPPIAPSCSGPWARATR